MDEELIRFERGFTLEDAMLEDDNDYAERVENNTIFPPVNATSELTDEDSGEEETLSINNLPGSQLHAPPEIIFQDNSNKLIEKIIRQYDVPLSELRKSLPSKSRNVVKKKQKNYHWANEDLSITTFTFYDTYNPENLDGPLQIFSKFSDDDLIELIVRKSNRYAQQRNIKSNIESYEIKGFIGILILIGYIQIPNRRIFWEREKDGHNELVAEVLSRDRFEYISSNVYVANNEELDQADKFAKIRPIHRKAGGELDQLSFRRRVATGLLTQNKKRYDWTT
ncbi:hypothetical protein ILUMI_16153 [Ignelater luminosus]|uniref:PiggyBac transposable element-derived protein domain-containing protein n=1 Tax=Ignelater luminosus TaxID=2038154 RepID=A0A8K0CUZ8_IGNLU|nr:hypothetical protein ILUMI_16153 [Ignelater luminosus]